MKLILREIIAFYKDPKDLRADDLSFRNNIHYILVIVMLDLIFFALMAPILHYIHTLKILPDDTSNIIYKQNTLFFNVLTGGILVPFVEELIFRFPLRFNKIYGFFISEKKWQFLFKILVYSFPFIFGIVHLSNFESINVFILIALSPILIGSQLVGGYLYTFLRVKFNFLSALFCHVIWNCLLILIFVPINYFERPYEVQNGNFKLYMKDSEYSKPDEQIFSVDTSNGKIYKISVKEYSINHVMDSLFKINRNKVDFIVDLRFNSKEGITKNEFIKLIEVYDNSN